MKKRIWSALLTLVMVLMLIPGRAEAATTRTCNEAVAWAKAQVGVSEGQCVALVRNYYSYLGVSPVSGNGSDYASNACPSGWKRIPYSQGFKLEAGDILVWSYTNAGGNYGHVAICIESSTDLSVAKMVTQNPGKAQIQRVSWVGGTFWGVIRPDFDGSTPSFSYTNMTEGTYYLKNVSTGGWLNLAYGKDENKQNIHVYSEFGYRAEQMRLYKTSDGYKLRPVVSASRVVNVFADTVVAGKNVNLYDDVNNSSQWWKFQPVSGGYIIHNAQNTNCVLDVKDGWDAYVDTYSGGTSQKWMLQSCISFDANGGSGAPDYQLKDYGSSLTLSRTVPSRSGYTFKGWATSSGASTAQYQPGSSYTAEGNATLYAVWAINTPSPSFSYTNMTEGTYYLKNVSTGGWLNVSYGKDENEQNIHAYSEFGYRAEQMRLCKASDGYKLRPVVSASRVVNVFADTVVAGKNVNLYDDVNISRQWWKFEPVSGGYIIHNAQNTNCVLDVRGGQGDAYVDTYNGGTSQKWMLQSCISFDANGGSGAPDYQLKDYGSSLTLSRTVPSRSGYTFKGWATSSGASTAQYQPGSSYTAEGIVTLYAVWAETKPLTITAAPKSVTATVGETVKLTVKATGTGLKYQWQYKKADGTWANTTLTGAKTATLSVTAKAEWDGRLYRCVVTDANGNKATSKGATLTVKAKVTAAPKSVAAAVGETVKFTVQATGVGLKYQWQYKKADGTWANTTLTGAKTATLSVTVKPEWDGRYYRCVVTDKHGYTSTSKGATLTVKVKVTAAPKSVTATVGETVQFKVQASGAGLKYQWQYKKADGTWANTVLTGAKTATLTVTAKAEWNGRYYRCVVTDKHGYTSTSKGATLTVKK